MRTPRSTIFKDFQGTLNVFLRGFFDRRKIRNDKLEGEVHLVTPRKFIHILNCMESRNSQNGHSNFGLDRIFYFQGTTPKQVSGNC